MIYIYTPYIYIIFIDVNFLMFRLILTFQNVEIFPFEI